MRGHPHLQRARGPAPQRFLPAHRRRIWRDQALIAQLALADWACAARAAASPAAGRTSTCGAPCAATLSTAANCWSGPTASRKYKPRPLVVIADISGSMERYTRLLLHFIYSLTLGLGQPVESFVFSTRLTRITRQLEHEDVEHALREVSGAVTDWAGGTRIGEALQGLQLRLGPARAGPRRGGADHQRRLGPRRRRTYWRARWRACSAPATA